MDSFRQDLRYALRAPAHRPGFTLAGLLTPALGIVIGATTAIVSVVRSVLLRPLPPYADRNGLDVLSISLRTGRLFEATDRAGTLPVALVNQAAAQRFWPGADPVSKRINVHMALGARIRQVVGLVMWQGIALGLIGLALGVAGAMAGRRVIAGLHFGVQPHVPLSFAGVTLLLLAVVGVACIVPASRAGRIPPASACAPIRRRDRSLGGSL